MGATAAAIANGSSGSGWTGLEASVEISLHLHGRRWEIRELYGVLIPVPAVYGG